MEKALNLSLLLFIFYDESSLFFTMKRIYNRYRYFSVILYMLFIRLPCFIQIFVSNMQFAFQLKCFIVECIELEGILLPTLFLQGECHCF